MHHRVRVDDPRLPWPYEIVVVTESGSELYVRQRAAEVALESAGDRGVSRALAREMTMDKEAAIKGVSGYATIIETPPITARTFPG